MNEVNSIDSNIISVPAQSAEPIEKKTTNSIQELQPNTEASVLGTYVDING